MTNEWIIMTPIGEITTKIDFFERLKIKKIKDLSGLFYIELQDSLEFGILQKDWNEINQIIRNKKIKKILNGKH
jgi:hypothetical protein